MAGSVKTRKVTSSIFLPHDQIPVSELPDKLRIIREFVADPTATDCRNFTEKMELWREKELYKHFADTWEQFCKDNFNQPFEWIEHVMQGVRLLESEGHKGAITVNQAIQAAKAVGRPKKEPGEPVDHRTTTLDKVEKVKELRAKGMTQQQIADELGTGQKTVSNLENLSNKNPDNIRIKSTKDKPQSSQYGTAKEWTIAKLRRDDKEDIAAQVESGKMTAAEARRQVYGEKPRMQFTVGDSTTPEAFAASLYEKLKPDFLAALVAALTDVLTTDETREDKTDD